ncbi:Response regulatory domain-containing protein [Bordetella sputigena]|uniref:response regulator n=1 Tax=Bordetella sputigena TaxID=1416810 RepID=UPI0039EFB992
MTDKTLQILIVDDNEMASELLSEFVELLGHGSQTTATAGAAIAACEARRPDVVITDIVLPDLDGYELASRLRAAYGKELRILALSGLPRNNDRAEAVNFDAWLEKPLDLSVLERMLGNPGETTT